MDEVTMKKIEPKIAFVPTKLNERQHVLSQIHERYLLDKNLRKKENWKRYVAWLKENRTPDSKEMQTKFRKTKMFIQELSAQSLAFKLSHIPVKDLYYFLSAGKEQKNFSAWLLSSIKVIHR